MDLNDAEMSRFVDTLDWDSKADDALKYINFHVNTLIDKLDPNDKNYAFFYTRYNKILQLTNALIGNALFEFDSRDDLLDLFNDKAKMLNQRAITDALMAHGYSKDKFLNWVDKYSKFLEKDKQMIHDILDPWVEPDITVPNADTSTTSADANTDADTDADSDADSSNSANDDSDFDSVFGTDGEETDSDLFGTSSTATVPKVSATDVVNRIKSFDFTL